MKNLFDLSDYPCDFDWSIFYWILDISKAKIGISFWCFFTNTISYIILTFTIIFAAAGSIRCEKPKLLVIGSLVAVLDFFLGGVIVAALILVFCWLKELF